MNSRYELRLLIQPVLRYSDRQQSIQDGTPFVFAHGTNPELIVMLEAIGDTPERLKWQFLAARTSHAELHLEFDKQELWTCRRAGIDPEGLAAHYWLFVAEEPPE